MEKLKKRVIFQDLHPFYSCCYDASSEVIKLEQELDELMKETKDREMTDEEGKYSLEMQHILHMNEVSAPIFGVTAAENFMHVYACLRLSEKYKYSIEHVDRLDTYSKWMVIPALACGNEINKASTAMNDFRQLIKVRNNIIHSKPVIINNPTKQQIENTGSKIEGTEKAMRQMAKKAPTIFISLIQELLKIDKSKELVQLIKSMSLPVPNV
jgi:hypothetical protein